MSNEQKNGIINRMDYYYNKLTNCDDTTGKRRYSYNCMLELYNKYEFLHDLWEHIAENFKIITRFVKKVVEKVVKRGRAYKYTSIIDNTTDYDIYDKAIVEKCYLFRFLDSDDNLIYSKVGTATKQSIYDRLSQEIREYRKSGYDVQRVIVDRVWNCGEYPAEGLESRIRSEYIKKRPKCFKKNDRFIDTLFDLVLCDNIAENYLFA